MKNHLLVFNLNLTSTYTKIDNLCRKLCVFTLALMLGFTAHATDNSNQPVASTNNQQSSNSVVAPQGANHSLSPIVTQNDQTVTYTLKNVLLTLPKTYQLQPSDYNQQLFFVHSNPQSIVVIQTVNEPLTAKINAYIPTVLSQQHQKLTEMVTQDLNNVLKNILLHTNIHLQLTPLVTLQDRNVLTYTGNLTTYRNTNPQDPNAQPQQMQFSLSGAELFYGKTLYLIFSMSPKQPVPFNNEAILTKNVQAVLDQLKLMPLNTTPTK